MKPGRSQRTRKLVARQRAIERQLRRDGVAPLTDAIYAASSEIHGAGVFAARRIPRGAFLIEYVGEKISKREATRRGEIGKSVYIFTLNRQVDIDGSVGGNGAHLINHGCDPNARAEWNENRINIIARRTIQAGEEITYDYGFNEHELEDYPCRCGAPTCRGYIVAADAWRRLRRRAARAAPSP